MKTILKLGLVAGLGFMLSACADNRTFVGFNKCAPDTSVVWWVIPNEQQSIEGWEKYFNEENCNK